MAVACAGADDRAHGDALRLIGLLPPLVEVCETHSLTGAGGAARRR
ncbi:hypothetical protein ABZY02_19480 [Streptomyces sp. NPDC006649]